MLTYADFPKQWVWHTNPKRWEKRKAGNTIGRIYFVHPNSGEQYSLRSELYNGLMDTVSKGDTDRRKVGNFILLPSSHTGSPTFKVQNYQDAMAICK